MARRQEDRGQLRCTLFPPEVKIRVLDEPHDWPSGDAGILYVTFSPSYSSDAVEYKAAADDLQECTRIVQPAATT